ncbi:MAG: hypothetical protein ABSE15_08290 [Candidatus Bathyarchaeia archaeon]
MKPKEARTRIDLSNEFYNFLFSQVEKLQLKLPESSAQYMFDSLNS